MSNPKAVALEINGTWSGPLNIFGRFLWWILLQIFHVCFTKRRWRIKQTIPFFAYARRIDIHRACQKPYPEKMLHNSSCATGKDEQWKSFSTGEVSACGLQNSFCNQLLWALRWGSAWRRAEWWRFRYWWAHSLLKSPFASYDIRNRITEYYIFHVSFELTYPKMSWCRVCFRDTTTLCLDLGAEKSGLLNWQFVKSWRRSCMMQYDAASHWHLTSWHLAPSWIPTYFWASGLAVEVFPQACSKKRVSFSNQRGSLESFAGVLHS